MLAPTIRTAAGLAAIWSFALLAAISEQAPAERGTLVVEVPSEALFAEAEFCDLLHMETGREVLFGDRRTDPDRFEHHGLTAGRYRVELKDDELTACAVGYAEVPGDGRTTLAFADHEGPVVPLIGRVTTGGAPLGGSRVRASLLTWPRTRHASARTDAEGRFELELPGTGARKVEVRRESGRPLGSYPLAHDYFVPVDGASPVEVEWALPTGRLTGHVRGPDGTPLDDHEVHWTQVDGELSSRVFTDAEGRFDVQRLPPGDYRLRAGGGRTFPHEWNGADLGHWSRRVSVTSDAPTEVEVDLDRGRELRCRFVGPDGEPFRRGYVYGRTLSPEPGPWILVGGAGEDGRLRMLGLPGGPFELLLREPDGATPAGATVSVPDAAADESVLQLVPATRLLLVAEHDDGTPRYLRVVDVRDERGLARPRNGAEIQFLPMIRTLPLPSGTFTFEVEFGNGERASREVLVDGTASDARVVQF